uniref:Nucleoporin protein Ndc1-Nup n=1 Tax=Rhizophagus irregularis (strain DAOM 181602 / DAOM 197198 / MUCL 43194) TaxID=747089 RepID=U9UTL2_RHIID
MSTNDAQTQLSTYGLACGSTELGKTRNMFLSVSAGLRYWSFANNSSSKSTYSRVRFLSYLITILLASIRRNTPACLLDELHTLMYKKRTYITPLIYTISSIIIGWTYFDLIGVSYRRTRTMFLYPGTEDFWCPSHRKDNCKGLLPMINEHYLIALFHTAILGIWYGCDFLLRKRYMLTFNMAKPRYPFSLLKELLIIWNHQFNIFVWSTLTTALYFSMILWFIKLFIWNTIYEWLPNLIFLHNTSVYYWMRASWFDVQLFNRTVVSAIFTVMCWSVIDFLIEHFFTRIHFTISVYMDPHAILVDGLHSYQQPYYQQLAFLELWHIAKFDQHRRSAIYADFNRKRAFNCVKHNNPTSAWTEISRSCMDLILGLASSAQNEIKKQQARKLLLKKKKERKIVGYKDLEVKMTAETMTKDHDYWGMKLLEWFHPVTALTALTVKSLNEDKHGIVQCDIANVFESILDCLMSLDQYSKEPPLDEWDVGDPFTFTYSSVLSDPLIVINVLKDALFDLTKAFYPHMDYVKLSSIHYDRLNKLLNEGL